MPPSTTRPRSRLFGPLSVVAGALGITTCDEGGHRSPTEAGPASIASVSTSATPNTLVGAGNIGRCDRTGDEATAALLDGIPGTVFTIGDNAYPNGTTANYTNCYGPNWGRHKARTYPALGNHEYDSSPTAAPYFSYYGTAAGEVGKGYYSHDLGAWHIIVLNSNKPFVPTAAGSPQELWLKADLAATTKQCILALWHNPRFYSTTSSSFSPTSSVKAFWDDLYAAHATLILNAHMHDYERFAPQTPAGVADPVTGIRQIIVGTGGGGLDPVNTLIHPNSEARIHGVHGVLKLSLGDGAYSWQFIPVAGQTASDAGNGSCYSAGPATPSVNAGPDLAAAAGDPVRVTATFTDPGPNDGPWTYTITWGDGGSSNGTATGPGTPITESHVYAAPGLDSVRVTVTNRFGNSGGDSLAVQVSSPHAAILVGAGNIADSATNGDSLTANLLDGIAGTVVALGDNAYPMGTAADYTKWYAPTWGRHLARTRPVPGNHDYDTPGASGYFGYFGAAAGDPAKGYYSYDLGDWHIIALNGELDVSPGSAEVQWLRSDLALSGKQCTLAYWHAPRFVSGTNTTSDPAYQTLWDTLYAYGAEVVLNAHKHSYERFAPQSPVAVLDTRYGMRAFVVGTGGTGISGGDPVPVANSEVRNADTWGVLKLTLNPGSYTWQFVPVAGQTFADAGSGICHDAPPATNRAPAAAPGGPYTGAEGSAVSFDGSGSSDPDGDAIAYGWSFGDGGTGPGATPSHTYADNGNYVVTLTVTDTHAAASTPATTTVTIGNVAPTVNTGANQSATVGSPVAVSASFSDRGVNDGPWGYSIDWGDGTTPSAGTATSQASPVTGTHTYGAAGTNTVRVTVTDKDGGAGSGTLGVTVVQPVASVTLVGAGNIARCDRTGDEATAAVLDGIAGTVFALGDAAYPGGTATSYQNCYHPSWGRHKARTYPVPGHRDYDSSATATGYFSYFGTAAGDPTKGYYSYDLGAWHIVALNSNSSFVATAAGSPQETWLRADLAATTKQCVLALWHHPRFYSTTSSSFSPTSSVKPFWDDLVAARAELIINAHLRDYERFGPQTSAGVADPVNGIRQIIVGSGGEGLDNPNTLIAANSEVRISGVYGVLQLTLYDGSYSWQFVPVAGQTATDSGSGSCR